jgi:hypothetical protein
MEDEKARGLSSAASPLIPPPSSEIDLEAGAGDQLQCRICLETDGTDPSPRELSPPLPPHVPRYPRCSLVFWAGVDCFSRCPCAGRDFIAPCRCKGTSKYVHRDCLDHWRAVKVRPAYRSV